MSITKEEAEKIWGLVKANRALLDACSGPHDFQAQPLPEKEKSMLRQEFRCSKCGGVVDRHVKFWYDAGVAHGQKHAAEPPGHSTGP